MHLNPFALRAARASQWVKNTFRFRKEMGDLNRLSDRELRDMGLSRYDVAVMAKNLKDGPVGH